MVSLDLEVFALRDNEQLQLFKERPQGRFVAVMLRSVEMPAGARSPVRDSDKAPVVQAAVLGCEWSAKAQHWQWIQISQPSKERIGDKMIDDGCEPDVWFYLSIVDLTAQPKD